MPIKVLFDHQAYTRQEFGGISRYFSQLHREFAGGRFAAEPLLPPLLSNNNYLAELNLPGHTRFFPGTPFPGKRTIQHYLNLPLSAVATARGNFDIFHPGYYNPYFMSFLRGKPFVVTVYDMIHELFPDLFSPTDRVAVWKRAVCLAADKVICISNSTKRDLVRLIGLPADKASVIHLAGALDLEQAKPPAEPLPARYILFVGERRSYKNFFNFAVAAARLMSAQPDLHMVCTGGGPFSGFELGLLRDLAIAGRTKQLSIDDRTLAWLYSHAEFFVFPSRYEGFGIPLLEAFSCACPVAASSTSSLPEVAGDAAVYFDPGDRDSIYAAMSSLLSQGRRQALRVLGAERLKSFSWGLTAGATADCYRSVLEGLRR